MIYIKRKEYWKDLLQTPLSKRQLACGSVEAGKTLLVLVLLLGDSLLSLEDCFSVLVDLQLGDEAVGRVDGNLHLGTYTQCNTQVSYRWSSLW